MQRPLNRIEPGLPAVAMRTHAIIAPLKTHFRTATCEEIDCQAWREGWGLAKKHLNEEDVARFKALGFRFTTLQIKEGEDHLWFEAGQTCFRGKAGEHHTRVDRPELYVARDGDWRGNPLGTEPTVFSSADSWADSLNTNLERLQD